MQLNTKATKSVKCLYRNNAPPTIICVGVMKLYFSNFTETTASSLNPSKNRKGKPVMEEESRQRRKIRKKKSQKPKKPNPQHNVIHYIKLISPKQSMLDLILCHLHLSLRVRLRKRCHSEKAESQLHTGPRVPLHKGKNKM